MQGNERPRGRHTVLRAVCATAIATLALGAGAAAVTAAGTVTPPTVELLASGAYETGPLVAGPDGAMWSYEHTEDEAVFRRYRGARRISSVRSPRRWPEMSALTPQHDGGMAIVLRDGPERVRVSVDASGQRTRAASLPRSARTADAFALAADGTVWWVDACADTLYRWRPGKAPVRVRLLPVDCSGADASALAIGPDGAVWYLNAAQGRIVRHDARGRTRQWSFERSASSKPAALALDPRGGGAVFSDGTPWGGANGTITSAGRRERDHGRSGQPAYAGDGAVWWATRTSIVGRDGGWPLPERIDPVSLAIARDGSPWLTTGRYVAPLSLEGYFHDLAIATVQAGTFASWPLAVGAEGRASQSGEAPTPLTLGGDGALWTRVLRGWSDTAIVRIVPPGLSAPRKPVARVTRALARDGRTVVLQVRCSAERGRFCRGTVGLGSSAKAARYVAPGQNGAAVSLTLTRRAAARLRRAGALKLGAQVRSTGAGTTRATVRLRR